MILEKVIQQQRWPKDQQAPSALLLQAAMQHEDIGQV